MQCRRLFHSFTRPSTLSYSSWAALARSSVLTGSADVGRGIRGDGDTEADRLFEEYRDSLYFISDNTGG